LAFPAEQQGRIQFTPEEISSILAATKDQAWKDVLTENTKKVLEQGAFRAPWMWVTNGEGKQGPFFGSDRFHFLWRFLGVPYRDVEIIPRGEKAKL